MLSRKLLILGILVTACLGTALVGCGSDSSVVAPPGDQQPLPVPDGLNATVDAQGNVALSWQASANPAVAGFNLYRYSPSPSRESSYLKVNGAPLTNASSSGEIFALGGDFRVKSVAAGGRESAASQLFHLDPFSPSDNVQHQGR